jgi:hypothetical protein
MQRTTTTTVTSGGVHNNTHETTERTQSNDRIATTTYSRRPDVAENYCAYGMK